MIKRNSFGFHRKSGILMPISSLPSAYGIGTFGKPCFDFLDFLAETKQTCWQVLPLNPTAYGDSPYQTPSAFAGNPYFIDLDGLYRDGLLTKADLQSAKHDTVTVDYGWLFSTRIDLLRKAYARFLPDEGYRSFVRKNVGWLDDYALFMALKVHYGYRAWAEWNDEHKFYQLALKTAKIFDKECDFWRFVQYRFFVDWAKVREYARLKGVKILGDMPIYVAYDSVDVWSNTQQFLLDNDLAPTLIAGVPPDGFSPDGQLWGNPIYAWQEMRRDGFKWWIERIKNASKLYDFIRIDHFRGFAGYYVVKNGETTARNGWWEVGVGTELFDQISQKVPRARIIAEDLGFITDDVRALLSHTGYPGMKVLQFAFDNEDNEYLPRLYADGNCVVYTGTHDSDVSRSWVKSLNDDARKRFDRECPRTKRESRTHALIMLAMRSVADLAIIPIQDYMQLGDEARVNRPSAASGNWIWRVKKGYATKSLKSKILTATMLSKRAK